MRQIARLCEISPGTVHRELRKLADVGLASREREGNRVRFRANRSNPVFPEIASLLKKTVGLADVLRQALSPLSSRIQVAAVYGSVARGEERPESDVDLLVIGQVGFVELVRSLGVAQETLCREINPSVYTPEELRAAVAEGEGFAQRVLSGPLIYVLGAEDDLGELAQDREAT